MPQATPKSIFYSLIFWVGLSLLVVATPECVELKNCDASMLFFMAIGAAAMVVPAYLMGALTADIFGKK